MAKKKKKSTQTRQSNNNKSVWWGKMAAAIAFDIFDLAVGGTIGIMPGVGEAIDIGGTILSMALWGWPGVAYAWEVASPLIGNTIDGFIPTCAIIGVTQYPRD